MIIFNILALCFCILFFVLFILFVFISRDFGGNIFIRKKEKEIIKKFLDNPYLVINFSYDQIEEYWGNGSIIELFPFGYYYSNCFKKTYIFIPFYYFGFIRKIKYKFESCKSSDHLTSDEKREAMEYYRNNGKVKKKKIRKIV